MQPDRAAALEARSRNATRARSRAFIVEALVLLVFLATSVAIVLQLFATAGALSRDAHTLSMSEHLATNAAEQFQASPSDGRQITYFTTQGEPLPSESTATFAVDCIGEASPTRAGTLYTAEISVRDLRVGAESDTPYHIQTARYLSASEGGGS